ncbi:high mobility group box domain-containing protein [Gamsiella multidivaricata]|uniref:high mobility group box domain-containing protein n=1 Tax=Gamsiella multidivaricata TaxID=101098 RepID=UPI00221F75BE|nr:high mobility group box domain-containing protein [Gamsiella multidivaricata]KAI7820507.1 high mobility group box domain-containing protein [Gamsiella multidivaricata]
MQPQQPQSQQQQQQQQQYYKAQASVPLPLALSQPGLHPSGRPKRPPNAFLVFSSVRRPELQKLYPSYKTAALSKCLGEEWRDMSPDRKRLYTSRARDIKDTFQANHPEYVYTRRSSKKRALADADSGSSKKFKGSDNYGDGNNYATSTGLDPNRPRRPMNSYLIFNQEMRHKLLLENANLTVSEISRAIGQKWANMTPDMKREYTEKAATIKADFLKKNPDYVYSRRSKAEIAASGAARRRGGVAPPPPSVPVSGKAGNSRNGSGPGHAAAQASTANSNRGNASGAGSANNDVTINGKDIKLRGKKRTKDPDAPKHPIPGFLFFRSGERARIRQMNPNQPIPSVAAKMWNEMTPEQREPWLQMAAQDKLRYAEEMQAYSARKGRMGKGRS